jgi:hypothetical protein
MKMKEILKFGMTSERYTALHHILASIVDECVMEFNESGLSVVAVNPQNTSMVKVTMKKRAFTEYELENPVNIGVNLRELEERGLLKNSGDKDVKFVISKHKHNENNNGQICELSHDIFCESASLLDPETVKNPKWPETETNCYFPLLVSILQKVSSRSELVCIECGNSYVTFSDTFSDNVWATIPIPILCGIRATSTYGAEWLKNIVEAIPTEHINIQFANDYPCIIKTKFGKGCEAEWLVAPKIERN